MEKIFDTLTKIIKEHDEIIIMTHKNPDFDGMGSAIALGQVISSFNKNCYIYKSDEEKDKSLIKVFKYLSDANINCNIISDNIIKENSLIIILDTHRKVMLETPTLLDSCKNIVLIDHHIKSKDYIKDTIFTYINSALSSTVEFVANYIKYLNKNVDPLIATFMQVGLEIDTNNFKLKTSDKTFETAAFLSRMGSNSVLKQELLKETKEEYMKKYKTIEKSFMIDKNTAMCIGVDETYEKKELASIAEELLQFEDVESSYAIGYLEKNIVGVSARSIGNVDVEAIMSFLGGGGHTTEAAAQITDKTTNEVKEILIKKLGG